MGARRLELCSNVRIGASPSAVWAVLVDAASWPRWCGPVRAMHAIPSAWRPGERLSYTLSMGPGVPVRFDVTLDRVEVGRELGWTSSKWWGVRGDRRFVLTADGEGTIVEDHKIFASGWWPVGRVYPRGSVTRMSERWLADLAAEVGRR